MNTSTIAAIATPTGRGGIAIIRISGDDARFIAQKVFVFPRQIKLSEPLVSHRVYYGYIHDANKRYIDEVLLIYMKAPRSYTAEDVVEIQSHASPVVLRKILDAVFDAGAIPAAPGEFTKRAFLNGRIDLTQAEAVIDIINARSGTSLDMALSQVRGRLGESVDRIISVLSNERAILEAAIDFPDDVGDIIDLKTMTERMTTRVYDPLIQLKQNFDDSNIFRDGIKLVIAGPPNSGKSSLLNALLEKEKSIVTPIPGTTRDLIDDLINIQGIPFEITDTAGIQETCDTIEQIGISRTMDRIKNSDVILLMYDGSGVLNESDIIALNALITNHGNTKKIVLVENKIDLYNKSLSTGLCREPDIRMSVLKNTGIDKLKSIIADRVIEDLPEDRSSIVPNARHARLIGRAITACSDTLDGLNQERDADLIAMDLDDCLHSLEEIVGRLAHDDVLETIFQSFCIGK